MDILEHKFSTSEYESRKTKTLDLAQELGCEAVFTFGENKNGIGITWLTGWGTTRLAYHFMNRSESVMWIMFHNHLAAANRVVKNAEIKDFSLDDIEIILKKYANSMIATFGVVPKDFREIASQNNIELKSIDLQHNLLRSVKSIEEIEALSKGAYATDCGGKALIEMCKKEVSDWELLAEARSSYTRLGARDHICYLCVSDMTIPDRDVPSQFPEGRIVKSGSIVVFNQGLT